MTNNVFIDSSILIEYFKKNNVDLLNHLMQNDEINLLINSIVVSEYLFHHLAIKGEKSPRSIKESRLVATILTTYNPQNFLEIFEFIDVGNVGVSHSLHLMKSYNLLPNDALILATCISHNIKAIASFDSDFEEPCKQEGIILLKSVDDLKLLA